MLRTETHTPVVHYRSSKKGLKMTACGLYRLTASMKLLSVTEDSGRVDCWKCLEGMATQVEDTLEDGECTACGHPRSKHSGGWEYGGGGCSMPRCICLGFHADE